jgi:hypothetical protein
MAPASDRVSLGSSITPRCHHLALAIVASVAPFYPVSGCTSASEPLRGLLFRFSQAEIENQ